MWTCAGRVKRSTTSTIGNDGTDNVTGAKAQFSEEDAKGSEAMLYDVNMARGFGTTQTKSRARAVVSKHSTTTVA